MEQLLEYFGVLTGLLYLFLEIRQHRAMWVVGFLTSLVYVFVFFFSKIYADMGLNIYYVAISIYGFWQWTRSKGRQEQTAEDIETAPQEVILYRNMTLRLFAGISFSIVALFALLYYVLHYFTDSPIPAGDAFTTAVGIVATWMLARRIVEHWIFWSGLQSCLRWVLDLLDRRQLRIRLSLLPAWALSHNVSLYLLRHTGGSRIIHLEKERNKNK